MRLSNFDFSLPEALIAQRPVYPRAAARLLHVRGDGSRVDRTFADLATCLRDGARPREGTTPGTAKEPPTTRRTGREGTGASRARLAVIKQAT